MLVRAMSPGGRYFDICDGDKVVASVMCNKYIACRFAASDEMLELLKMFVEAHDIDDSQLMRVRVGEARELIERVEGE